MPFARRGYLGLTAFVGRSGPPESGPSALVPVRIRLHQLVRNQPEGAVLVIGPRDESAIELEAATFGSVLEADINVKGARSVTMLFGVPIEWGDRTAVRLPRDG